MPELSTLEARLSRIEQLARGSVWARFLNSPARYAAAIGYWRLVYPFSKKGRFARARTFFDGEMEVVLPSATEIYLFGAKTHDSEIRLARFLMKNLEPGDTFCDVGAHFGYFTLLASNLVGQHGRVISLEASPSTFGILKKNTVHAANVTIHHLAASDQDVPLVFNEFPALYSEYNSLVLPEKKQAAWLKDNAPQQTEVQGMRLDSFFISAGPVVLPKIIKIDVEGAEPQVLRGMEGFLKQHSPTLVMEYLTMSGQNVAHREAVAFACRMGYRTFRIRNDGGMESSDDIEASLAKAKLDSDNIVLIKK